MARTLTFWRYYLNGIGLGYAVAGAVLMSIFFLFDLISEAETVGDGGYSFLDAAAVVLLQLPTRFVELSPVIAMLGITYGLAVFGRNLELVAIRTTGVSSARLAFVAVVSVLLLYVVVSIAELAGRPMHQASMSFRMLQVAEQGQPVRGDLWIADPAGMVRISDWDAGLEPRNIELFEFDAADKLQRYVRAPRATVQADGVWRLYDAAITDFSSGNTQPQKSPEFIWRPRVYRNLTLFDLPVQGLSLLELEREIARREAGGEDSRATRLEFWKRCLLPLSGMMFALFASAIGLREGERGGVGRQLAVGVVAALILYLAQQIVLNASLVAGWGPVVAVSVPIGMTGLLALVLLRRAT